MSLLDIILLSTGILVEASVIALLVYRRTYRNLPIFFLFLIWTIVSDFSMMALSRHFGDQSQAYYRIYVVEFSLDFILQFAILVELAWAVLRPIRSVLPRRTIPVISVLLLMAGAAIWPIAGKLTLNAPTPQWHILMQMQEAFSILRVLFVLVVAGFSQLLAIGWRDRELQVATGLGFYWLVTLGASIVHTQHLSVPVYHRVDQLIAVSYLCSLVYWVFSFAQQEAARQEFTPGMQGFLLAVSGAARADRMALQNLQKSRK